jgi:hypothetical protein
MNYRVGQLEPTHHAPTTSVVMRSRRYGYVGSWT